MPTRINGGASKFFLVALLIAIGVAAFGLWQRLADFADSPLAIGQERVLLLERGDGLATVLAKLRAQGIREGHDLEWKALAKTMKVADRLQVGEYALTPDLTPRQLLTRLSRGEVIQRKFTIVEGWNFRELRVALVADAGLEREIGSLGDAEVMQKIGRPGIHPEGRFLPETYVYTRGSGELSLLKRAADDMDAALARNWSARGKDLPLQTPDEMLTLASIVEKETGLASERPLIAGVFLRRLSMGMRLQTDPTVIYGMGSAYAGNIRKTDLETDTPYNTYTRAGLPPTPIAMPGEHALRSVAQPTAGNSLYFVARGGGSHYFSATLAEHNAAVRKYQLKR